MKTRADILLWEQGLAASREKAKVLIMAGAVYFGEQRVDKPGAMLDSESVLTVRGGEERYVSRGGKKLEKAIETFPIDLHGCICADIGASTGGFTDCMLQNGAQMVYAIDVGYGQLAWSLRNDARVVNIERTNIRYITAEQLPIPLDFFSVDVSFISLKLVLPAVVPFLKPDGSCVCLIKPQFEAGREQVGKNGVVRDKAVHIDVIRTVLGYLSQNDLCAEGLTHSPIKGPKGNIEYLVYCTKSRADAQVDIEAVVEAAHTM